MPRLAPLMKSVFPFSDKVLIKAPQRIRAVWLKPT
jgi:hypothetical protein